VRSQQSDLLAPLAPGERPQRLGLQALSVASLHRIVAGRLGRTFPRPVLVRIAEASAGNPFYALEVARLLDRQGVGATAALPVPENLQTLVAGRVGSLPARTRDALLRAASLARPDPRLAD